MELFSIVIWIVVVIMFVIMIIVIIRGGNAFVYIFDEHNAIYKRKGKVSTDKVSFKYNDTTKGGIAIEKNKYKSGKKLAFFYRDIGGILLPITDSKISDKLYSLDLSTSQEKLYETRALENVANKIDNTLWAQMRPIVMGAIILMVAMVVSIVMIQKAMDVEPVPEPQLLVWQDTSKAMIQLVESNQQIVDKIESNKYAGNNAGDPPK